MNMKVMYHSLTGNTKKLAQTIADSLHVQAEPIGDTPPIFTEQVDLLFIGDGIYGGKPNKHTIALINSLTPDMVKQAAVFATYGREARIGRDLKALLEGKGIAVLGEPFTCKGQAWLLINRHHPNDSDLDKAKAFALDLVEKAGV